MLRKLKKIWKTLNSPKKSNSRWVTVVNTSDLFYSSICKNTLEQEGIPVMIIDQRDSSYTIIGEIHLQVLQEDVIKAQKILNSPDE